MSRIGATANVEHLGLAVAAGLLALLAPVATIAVILVLLALLLLREAGPTGSEDMGPPLVLAGVAIAGVIFGAPGAVAAALVWRAFAEIAHCRETQGLTEPPWMALIYRWAPVTAALLVRLEAPALATTVASLIAAVALADWSLRRLAEWRLGEPQPFDTGAYLTSQSRVLALLLVFPEPAAALAAFAALGLARVAESPVARRYAVAR